MARGQMPFPMTGIGAPRPQYGAAGMGRGYPGGMGPSIGGGMSGGGMAPQMQWPQSVQPQPGAPGGYGAGRGGPFGYPPQPQWAPQQQQPPPVPQPPMPMPQHLPLQNGGGMRGPPHGGFPPKQSLTQSGRYAAPLRDFWGTNLKATGSADDPGPRARAGAEYTGRYDGYDNLSVEDKTQVLISRYEQAMSKPPGSWQGLEGPRGGKGGGGKGKGGAPSGGGKGFYGSGPFGSTGPASSGSPSTSTSLHLHGLPRGWQAGDLALAAQQFGKPARVRVWENPDSPDGFSSGLVEFTDVRAAKVMMQNLVGAAYPGGGPLQVSYHYPAGDPRRPGAQSAPRAVTDEVAKIRKMLAKLSEPEPYGLAQMPIGRLEQYRTSLEERIQGKKKADDKKAEERAATLPKGQAPEGSGFVGYMPPQ